MCLLAVLVHGASDESLEEPLEVGRRAVLLLHVGDSSTTARIARETITSDFQEMLAKGDGDGFGAVGGAKLAPDGVEVFVDCKRREAQPL